MINVDVGADNGDDYHGDGGDNNNVFDLVPNKDDIDDIDIDAKEVKIEYLKELQDAKEENKNENEEKQNNKFEESDQFLDVVINESNMKLSPT
eukprot:CAMPEP_0174824168 /NCGR_PEP_ID=MMETSP1107-20130205/31341_1 /TAXON_ID=36770 /ORGANISM="Paraphysomonas vestita, Strain GFlagA" /LENGTH=92 /DNA_ID=CAMNT_0016050031 /DNA_START=8 /DNA_END=283 /DNA_ORIENTATION=+